MINRIKILAIAFTLVLIPIVTFAFNFPQWTIKSCVDDFGSQTKDKFITTINLIEGTMSNEVVENTDLTVIPIIENKYSMGFKLFLYGGTGMLLKSNEIDGDVEYTIKVKMSDGTIYKGIVAYLKPDRIWVHPGYSAQLNKFFISGKYTSAQFYIENTSDPGEHYSFTLDLTGYSDAFNKLPDISTIYTPDELEQLKKLAGE